MEEEVAKEDVFGRNGSDIYGDGDDEDNEDDNMPITEPGQEGVLVWDLLGESFLQEVSQIAQSDMFFLDCFEYLN